MRVLVCGGRNFRSRAQVSRELDRLHAEHPIAALMQGGATGADQFAKEWAMTKPEIQRFECKAKWTDLSHADAIIRTRRDGTKYDAKAGHRRNARMLEWTPDLVVAFPGGDGTADMVRQAKAAGIKIVEVGV